MDAPRIAEWRHRKEFHQEAAAHYRRDRQQRTQETFDFPPAWHDPTLRRELEERHGPLCCFCESPSGTLAGEIGVRHFRPHDGVVTEAREMLTDYYWWLAYEEANLLLICADCESRKGKRFPVRSTRAGVGAVGADLDAEQPVLVHPDQFDDRMAYGPAGEMSGLDEEARQTVIILQLNRAWLVDARREAIEWVVANASSWLADAEADPAAWFGSTTPYFRACRQTLGRLAEEGLGAEQADLGFAQATTKTSSVIDAAQVEQRAYGAAVSVANVTDERSFETTRTIERIEIRNFKIIDHLELQLHGRTGEWRMLLGENGTGKSTLLQAIALTLIDRDYRLRLGVDPRRCVRRRCKRGWIEITLAGTDQPVRLEFDTDNPEWGGTADEPNAQVLGYGSTRLLPRPGALADDDSTYARTANLFDPFVALRDADAWLALQHAERPDLFNAAGRLLRQLLDERAAARLRLHRGKAELCENGVWKQLDQLSDGYQTVVALALDMMSVLTEIWPDMAVAEGVVLIDELGSHLHPRWQMRIVSSLRSAFPLLQFIVSTHNPLCLRGMQKDEVVLMRRRTDDPKRVIAVRNLPPIDGLRVDQLLTSPHFGLGTTLDQQVERDFQRLYELERKAGPTIEEIAELRQLEVKLAGQERLGASPEQSEMYRAINTLLLQDAGDLAQHGHTPLGPKAHAQVVAMLGRIDEDRARSARRGATIDQRGMPV